jgi:hypothetical protein
LFFFRTGVRIPVFIFSATSLTDRVSHLNIAFIVTECIMTCIEEDDDLFLITLDAQKAFDKLNHEILFNKIYLHSSRAISSAHVGDETLMFPICAPSPDANPAKSEIVNTANRLECPKVRRSRVITMK